jgi:FlaG/FlaF family flagellin (archaellin)
MHRIRQHLTYANVMATIAVFMVLGGTTYAATGGSFILGQSNSASSTTSLSAPVAGKALQVTNTSTGAGATALGLNVASGHPPFTVNSGAKVANLNADKLDGIDSTGFLPSSSVQRLAYTATAAVDPAPITPIATIGPFTIKGQCRNDGFHTQVRLYVNRGGPPSGTANTMWSETQDDTTDRGTKSTGLLIPTDTDLRIVEVDSGELAYGRGAGTSMLKQYESVLVQVDFHAVADSRDGTGSCFIYGTATRV